MASKIGNSRGGGSTPTAPPRDAKPGDNENAVNDAYANQLRSFVSKARMQMAAVAEIKTEMDTAKDELNSIFALAKGANPKFTRKRLLSYIEDMGARARDLAAEEEQRAKDRAILGLPVGSQLDLFKGMPVEKKDEAFWRADGYLAGQRGDDPQAPKECPSRMVQVWLAGYHDGQKVIAAAMTMTAAEPPPPPAAAEPEDKELTPGEKKAQERRARESLEGLEGAEPDDEDDAAGPAPDDFEASPDELAKQILRPQPEAEAVG